MMVTMSEPPPSATFVPATYDAVYSLAVVVGLVLLLAALRYWFGAPSRGMRSVLEVLLIVFVPIIGPGAYLLARRDSHHRETG